MEEASDPVNPEGREGPAADPHAATPPPPPQSPSPAAAPPTPAAPPPPSGVLGKQLRGDLPCFVCKYNLKGISIRGACPECGTAVRATILAMVDPMAKELRPIHRPRVVAGALAIWGLFSFLAAVTGWLPYITGTADSTWRLALITMYVLAGLGALCFVRPHAGIRPLFSLMALAACLFYIPLTYLAWQLTGPRWEFRPFAYPPDALAPEAARLYLRLGFDATLAAILLLIRPNARLLVARSLALRTGRVDRQTILAMVFAVGATAVGDALMLLAPNFRGVTADTIRMGGIVVVVAGSALLTFGTLGVLIDSFRIARAIVMPTPSLDVIIHGGPGDRARDQSAPRPT